VDARRGRDPRRGSREQIVEDQSTTPATYDPGHPKANEEGFVYLSNVNPMNELVEMTAAARSFESNIEAMNTAKQLMMRTVELLKK
jgi:flagellar basal-body rod protein FlgC